MTPKPYAPPLLVLPYRVPALSTLKRLLYGEPPSVPPVKLYSTLSLHTTLAPGESS
jgi:hypothetical protein